MLTALYAAFVLSGAAGLIYESIWTRYLGLFVGHSAYAQVIVLVIFLGGMSLGALLVGRRTERLRQPLLWYAGVELVTGIIGIAFHELYLAATHIAYSTIFPALGVGGAQTIAKWTIAALLILPQSILLGMTFPLMSAGVVRRVPERAGRALAMLYFTNSIGAAAGVIVAGFFLVAFAGLPGTLLVAGMLNVVVALAVYLLARGSLGPRPSALGPTPTSAERRAPSAEYQSLWRLLLAVSFGTALSSFIYEIAWIRMLALVLGSATHSFEIMLSAFILGLALGAFWIRRRADGAESPLATLGVVQIAMGTLAILTLPIYAGSFYVMALMLSAFTKTSQGYALFSAGRYLLCLAVMLPATFCAGMTLPLITRALMDTPAGERAIGQVYGVNTFGSIVGAALAGLVLMPLLGLKWLLIAGASVDLALGVVLLMRTRIRPTRGQWLVVGEIAALILFVIVGVRLDRTVLTSGVYRYGTVQPPGSRDILFYKDGRTATVSVRRLSETKGLNLSTNGKPDASIGPEMLDPKLIVARGPFTHDAPTQFLLPAIALAHVPSAREAAVIGQGSGMTSHVLLASPKLEHLVTIEIEPEMIHASRLFYPANRRVFDDRRAHFAIDDARSYFAAKQQRFDLIVSEPSNPWVSGVSGLFTSEFYARARHYLNDTGVFAQWLHMYEIDDGLIVGILAALAQQFPSFAIFQVSNRDIIVVASPRALAAPDWSVMDLPALRDDLRSVWPLTPRTMETLRVADAPALAPILKQSVPNSDFYPTLDLNAERTRYMKTEAVGFAGLAGGRINLPAIISGRRNGIGDPYAVIIGVPRLTAMAENAAARTGDPRAGRAAVVTSARREMIDEQMRGGRPPVDWRVWVQSIAAVEEAYHGGMAGVADSSFYAPVRAYMARTNAPADARAAIDFLHGMAAWDFPEASKAADTLLAAAFKGDLWLDADVLRDGAVMAKVETGHRTEAVAAFTTLNRYSARTSADLRTRLLYSYILAK